MSSLLRVFALSLLPIVAFSACGGTSTDDNGGGTGGVAGGGRSGSSGAGNASGFGGSTGGASGASGGSTGGSAGSSGVCPASFPDHGTACSLPQGVACSYDQGPCCPAWISRCEGGIWQGVPSPCPLPPTPACPIDPPTQGSPCSPPDPCGGIAQQCTYGKCEDGSPSTFAECQGGAWNVWFANCRSSCEGLSPCECFARSDCQAVSDSCICPCDYQCPGEPPCACACGGGTYLGCKSTTAPGG